MGGEGNNAFLKFLGGPWGIALSVAVVALTPLIGKLFEAGNGRRLKKKRSRRSTTTRAGAFANTLEKLKKEANRRS
jgi:hypothetical protein